MSDWLYEYWFFCFKTAKNWGRGPRAWTAELLDFARYNPHHSSNPSGTPQSIMAQSEDQQETIPVLTKHCRWYIHVRQSNYQPIPDDEAPSNPVDQDSNVESTWLPWPKDWQEPPLSTRLRDALEHNDFSSVSATILPVAIPEIAKAAKRSPNELLLESLGFSIMTRNLDQIDEILQQLTNPRTGNIWPDVDMTALYPFHMATSYLDGHKACCDILTVLLLETPGLHISSLFTNELGHTILDNLMISILKSHSSSVPAIVDDSWKDTTRFIGEEVDICGRWDADSPCVRYLLTSGNPSIPPTWKHKFCHTSIQTVWHCIEQMNNYVPGRLMLETASGLYVCRCFDCGLKLQLQPLHSLVMTTYHLANSSCQDEDLFGMLACLLCFISSGLDLQKTANVSVTALMQTDITGIICDHEDLTPAELAEKISEYSVVESWSTKVRTGWEVFGGVLRLCEDLESNTDDALMEDDDDGNHFIGTSEPGIDLQVNHFDGHKKVRCFHARRDVATLWASVQTELLSYRRLKDGMDWLSPRFSMEELKDQLERGESLSVGYVEQDLLKPHCTCGKFGGNVIAILADATAPDIANLDIWDRATYGKLTGDH
jgi:hypothetical protein